MSPILLAIVLGLLFAAVAAAFFWQEARSRAEVPEYVINDVIDHVSDHLPEVPRQHIQRIVESEVFYLQGLTDADPEGFRPIAGSDAAVDFVAERALKAGFKYDRELIEIVMALEAEYLASIGAIGAPVGAEVLEDR